MSSRAFKKLMKLNQEIEINEESEESSDPDTATGPVNNFNLLPQSITSDEADEEKVTSDEEPKPVIHMASASRKKKNKKKRMKAKVKNLTTEDEEDEVDRCLKEVNAILGEAPAVAASIATNNKIIKKHLLCIDYKHLNPANEMKRRFGAQVVEENQRENRRLRRPTPQQTRRTATSIVALNIDDRIINFQSFSMEKVGTQDEYTVYKFKHHRSYQKIQAEFMKISKSPDPEALWSFVGRYPFHVDALLLVSEMFHQMEDSSLAAKMIEYCIYAYQCRFHEQFSFTKGTCILDYKHKENRGFFIALFRQASFMNSKGCYRTALELSKLLLSLAPEEDPLAASLMIDYYALGSKEYIWLYNLFKEYNPKKNLDLLPNYAFSVPLALFHLSKKKSPKIFNEIGLSATECREKSDEMLQDALLKFPGLLMVMLDKCNIRPDTGVSGHEYFGLVAVEGMSKALTHLVKLYVYRNFYEWKPSAVVKWLEENAHKVLERVDKDDPLVQVYKEKREKNFVGMPLAIYRHLFMADVKDLSFPLPPHAADSGVLSYDPLPPPNSVCDYSLTNPGSSSANAESGANILETFVRSLVPDYVPAGPDQPDENQVQMQERVRALMDSLRQLFTRGFGGESAHEGDDDATN